MREHAPKMTPRVPNRACHPFSSTNQHPHGHYASRAHHTACVVGFGVETTNNNNNKTRSEMMSADGCRTSRCGTRHLSIRAMSWSCCVLSEWRSSLMFGWGRQRPDAVKSGHSIEVIASANISKRQPWGTQQSAVHGGGGGGWGEGGGMKAGSEVEEAQNTREAVVVKRRSRIPSLALAAGVPQALEASVNGKKKSSPRNS